MQCTSSSRGDFTLEMNSTTKELSCCAPKTYAGAATFCWYSYLTRLIFMRLLTLYFKAIFLRLPDVKMWLTKVTEKGNKTTENNDKSKDESRREIHNEFKDDLYGKREGNFCIFFYIYILSCADGKSYLLSTLKCANLDEYVREWTYCGLWIIGGAFYLRFNYLLPFIQDFDSASVDNIILCVSGIFFAFDTFARIALIAKHVFSNDNGSTSKLCRFIDAYLEGKYWLMLTIPFEKTKVE